MAAMSITVLLVILLSLLGVPGMLITPSRNTQPTNILQGNCAWNPITNTCECPEGSRKSSKGSPCQMPFCSTEAYLDSEGNCQPCHPTCLSCLGPLADQCSTCPSSSFFLNGKCIPSCPRGNVGVHERDRNGNLVGVCKKCSSSDCQTCSSSWPYVCHKCTPPATLTASGRCVFILTNYQHNSTLRFEPTAAAAEPQQAQSTRNYELKLTVQKGESLPLNDAILKEMAINESHVKIRLSTDPQYGFVSLVHGTITKPLSKGDVISVSDLTGKAAAHLSYLHDGTSNLAEVFEWEAYTATTTSQTPFAAIRMILRISSSNPAALLAASGPTIKLQMLEGQYIPLPSAELNLADGFAVTNAKYTIDTQLKYGILALKFTGIPVQETVLLHGDSFSQNDLDERLIWYRSTKEIGYEPVQEKLRLTVTIPTLKPKTKNANGRHSRVFHPDHEDDNGRSAQEYQTQNKEIVITIGPVDNQAPVVLVNSDLTVEEGGREIISPDTFSVTDPDSPVHQLMLIVDIPPEFGYLIQRLPSEDDMQFAMDEAKDGKQFPLQALLNEQLSYEQNVHKQIEPKNDTIGFRVSDGTHVSAIFHLNIEIENVNDEAPTVDTSILHVKEGETVLINEKVIKINDMDTDHDELILIITQTPEQGNLIRLTASNPEGAEAKLESQGVKLGLHDQLTWADMLDGLVAYDHDDAPRASRERGENFRDSAEFQLVDGAFTHTFSIPIQIEETRPTTIATTTIPPPILITTKLSSLTALASTASPWTSMEFCVTNVTVQENTTLLRIPVIRSGDLPSISSVICTTKQNMAETDTDFVERPLAEQSRIFFLEGAVTAYCDIEIIDNSIHEGTETFSVHLSHPQIEKSSILQDVRPQLGSKNIVQVTITDPEDTPTAFFEKPHYRIQRDTKADVILTLNILRTGDVSQNGRLGVRSRDGSAKQGQDFICIEEDEEIGPEDTSTSLDVLILPQHSSHKPWPITWRLTLIPLDNRTQLGRPFVTTVTILPPALPKPPFFPAEPVIISLLYYDLVQEGLRAGAHAGYPLVCLHSCDAKHPNFNETLPLCQQAKLLDAHIKYSWEEASQDASTGTMVYRTLSESTLFANVHQKVLDAAFFTSSMSIRCSVQGIIGSLSGLPSRSSSISIQDGGFCPPTFGIPNDSEVVGEQPFHASLNYVNSKDENHPDKLHIGIEIPHTDGMIPLVSTRPLHATNKVLTDLWYRSEHRCSNLHPGYGFLPVQESNASVEVTASWAFFLAANLRQEATVRLYRHLNLATCTWKFDAWYSMGELVDLCGGQVSSDFKTIDKVQTHVTVRVPLFVALITANSVTGWTSIEHRTEMDFSFYYTPSLWRRGLEAQALPIFQPQVTRVSTDRDGKLQIEFKTLAQFQGQFVLQDPANDSKQSLVQAPTNILSQFHLKLISSRENEQLWLATSNYSLQDYTGLYHFQLVPCIFAKITPSLPSTSFPSISNSIEESDTRAKESKAGQTPREIEITSQKPCSALETVNFSVPIVYQQAFRPVPVAYSLNTVFYLTKDPRALKPSLAHFEEEVFSPGDHVYGLVAWTQTQTLNTHYRLLIEQLYICAGRDGYVPVFDPTGENSSDEPQYGCLENSPKLKHRILLLDRNDPNLVLNQGKHASIEAFYASQVPELAGLEDSPGIDGFAFEVTPLYKLESGLQWYIQVQYSIGPSLGAHKTRVKRAAAIVDWLNEKSNIAGSQNGTNMRLLSLEIQTIAQLNDKPVQKNSDNKNSRATMALYGLIPFGLAGSVSLLAWAFIVLSNKRRKRSNANFTTEQAVEYRTACRKKSEYSENATLDSERRPEESTLI